MNEYPTGLKLENPQTLMIEWSDGERRRYAVGLLRKACPCASCREKRTEQAQASPLALPVVRLEEVMPVTIARMNPVGNYAYGIDFSDGHDTGIFTLELLKELGEAVT